MDAETSWFIESVTAYLAEMMTRGDQQAAQLFEQAVALFEEEQDQ
jgi:hypothetical protein